MAYTLLAVFAAERALLPVREDFLVALRVDFVIIEPPKAVNGTDLHFNIAEIRSLVNEAWCTV